MASKLIGKSYLGELGFCQYPPTMGNEYSSQWKKVMDALPVGFNPIITSMTGIEEREEANNCYIPQIQLYDPAIAPIFDPQEIYRHCLEGKDFLRPSVDFIIWEPKYRSVGLTFSRDAPIISFTSTNGCKAIGTILRPALLAHGDYLFSNIKKAMESRGKGELLATLETSTYFEYDEGNIPSIVKKLAEAYGMYFHDELDTRVHPECYHGKEKGNHVVALW